ncbi:hypothetical protein A3J20_05675 [Candidatus Gottesmanbacteria bacterium RIFCSPLOWO2_02_FULL_42_29]|uniref:HMA domain-containing protein n=2 Tax=Candidatus Gottesmaniibacteriota TaxID=1752720 RepID=A0A1F6BB38_9BACT|nr:MAG: hypothetical protein UV09_C0010G0015 [Candidatus Gottesmanbacteria bacterium GW2011_GWA2_42_18]KKS74276.1 MAG: hypothetical protein UV46_C0047G0001 [Candidatus Gottesmanbacteria bacterium GW2011_GWC2_42_8]OGG09905.1 MAG: hypothetical protein A2781_04450 [Candidatus Gottesmanbacteria bacterium RIFCSPHIGHO2_01_FULL_42_27]OGG33950.1 MAG: hypothetical protein A3G68_00290 [Candidatus Gottesmanbacteria bacterium RIFCSPLOWO2_12_FULL_42_10]OGG33982.1 MAG: hypothetical protein A2968_05760 [Candi
MADIHTLKFTVSGITCDACLKLIKRRVNAIEGVMDINLDSEGVATLTARREIDIMEITKALDDTDYRVSA